MIAAILIILVHITIRKGRVPSAQAQVAATAEDRMVPRAQSEIPKVYPAKGSHDTVALYKTNSSVLKSAYLIDKISGGRISLDILLIAHLGDSWVYLLGSDLEQLTEDHSCVAQQVKSGGMTKVEAANHSSRHILTSSSAIDCRWFGVNG